MTENANVDDDNAYVDSDGGSHDDGDSDDDSDDSIYMWYRTIVQSIFKISITQLNTTQIRIKPMFKCWFIHSYIYLLLCRTIGSIDDETSSVFLDEGFKVLNSR